VTTDRLAGTKVGRALLSLLALAILTWTLQSVVFSDASFTAGGQNPGNAFRAGNFWHTNSHVGVVVLDASRLRPGQSRSATLTITGGGDIPGAYTVSRAGLTDTPASPGLSNTLQLTVQDLTSGQTLYGPGLVSSFVTGPTNFTVPPNVTHTIQVTLLYPLASANSALQGSSMNLTLQFTGVSQ
jgi:hypothetical protein